MKAVEPTEKTLPPPWDRIFSLATRFFVWGLLVAILYLLRQFLLLVFLTFVFAYIQAHGVEGLAHRIKNRTLRVVIVGLVFLGTLFATGFSLLPEVREQATQFLARREEYVAQADEQVNKFLLAWPSVYDSLAKHSQAPDPTEMLFSDPAEEGGEKTTENGDPGENGQPDENGGTPTEVVPPPKDVQKPAVDKPAAQKPADEKGDKTPKAHQELHIVRDLVASVGESLAKNPLAIGQSVLSFASSFLLSLLFSFLIVLDLRKITRGVQGLSNTKIGFIYDEVADNIAGFGRVLGRALEAQLLIAVCNTILTAVCVWMMGIPNLLVLSTIVFFCSFIPVVGTFISSTPIALLALQSGGVSSFLLVILLIVVVHLIETYVLNPQIYGHHMHMNPVLVLIVLTICGKLFGIWGLILGIPIVNYVFRHAIRFAAERPKEA